MAVTPTVYTTAVARAPPDGARTTVRAPKTGKTKAAISWVTPRSRGLATDPPAGAGCASTAVVPCPATGRSYAGRPSARLRPRPDWPGDAPGGNRASRT